MNKTELNQWTAGFFDSDGTIGLARQGKKRESWKRSLVVSFANNDINMVRRVQDEYGGRIHEKVTSAGNINYNLTLNINLSLVLIKEIYPYIMQGNKKKRAKLILDSYEKLTPASGQNHTPESIEGKKRLAEEFASVVMSGKDMSHCVNEEMPELSMPYLAGFFEGDGYIKYRRYKTKGGYNRIPNLVFTNNDKGIIDAIMSIHGGSLYTTTTKAGNTSYQLNLNRTIMFPVLRAMRPYMVHGKKCHNGDLLLDNYEGCTPKSNGNGTLEHTDKKRWLEEEFMSTKMTGKGAY